LINRKSSQFSHLCSFRTSPQNQEVLPSEPTPTAKQLSLSKVNQSSIKNNKRLEEIRAKLRDASLASTGQAVWSDSIDKALAGQMTKIVTNSTEGFDISSQDFSKTTRLIKDLEQASKVVSSNSFS